VLPCFDVSQQEVARLDQQEVINLAAGEENEGYQGDLLRRVRVRPCGRAHLRGGAARMVVAEHWMDGPDRLIGLTSFQYMALLIGVASLGWAVSSWFRRKK
jgi:hypothetical protein